MIKRIASLLAVMIVGIMLVAQNAGAASSDKFPKLEPPVFVQDHADLISAQDKDEIVNKGQKLQDGTDSDILVMTMKSIGQTPKEDYAYQAGRHYKVGDQKHSRGVVILVNLDNGNEYQNRGIQVAVGRGLEGVLNDAKVGALIDDNFMPYAKKAAHADSKEQQKAYYSQGITQLYNAVWKEIAKAYGYDGEKFTESSPKEQDNSEGDAYLSVFGIFFLIVVILIIIFTKNGGGGPPRGGGRRRHDSDTWWVGSGGFGGDFGGSSGGGGFSGGSFGGGGGFGGGGAGRGF
ncbi:TPM domain-containing protein [Staphylococcus simulans]|uniref:TPM domain-containing protein n=1 Tax=Staphylococcus simulans TaxID=1286 RepID=UPI000D041461|nr:TPM domain-containing protein [Staphylococcus simulans]